KSKISSNQRVSMLPGDPRTMPTPFTSRCQPGRGRRPGFRDVTYSVMIPADREPGSSYRGDVGSVVGDGRWIIGSAGEELPLGALVGPWPCGGGARGTALDGVVFGTGGGPDGRAEDGACGV